MEDEEEFSLTFAEIKKLKVADLKARLSKLGLPVSGLKADLVARLASFLESRALQEALSVTNEGQEFDTHEEIVSPTRKLPPREARSQVVFLESDSDEDEPTGYILPRVSQKVSTDVCDVVTELTDNVAKEKGDTSVIDETPAVAEPSVKAEEAVDQQMETEEDNVAADEKVTQSEEQMAEIQPENDEDEAQRVEVQAAQEVYNQLQEAKDQPDKVIEPEEQKAEIEQENEEDEPQGVNVEAGQGVDNQLQEAEGQLEKIIDPDQTKSIEESTQELKQTEKSIEQDYVMVEHSEVPQEAGSDIAAADSMDIETKEEHKPEPEDVDQSGQDAKNAAVLPELVEHDPTNELSLQQHVSSSDEVVQELSKPEERAVSNEGMETESPVDVLQSSSVQDKEQHVSFEEPLQPSSESPEETSHPQVQPSHPQVQPSHPQVQHPQVQHPQVQPPHPPVQPPHPPVQPPHPQVQPPHIQVQPPHPQVQPPHRPVQPPHPPVQPPHPQLPHPLVHPPHPQVQPPHSQVQPPHPQEQPPHPQVQPPHPQVQPPHLVPSHPQQPSEVLSQDHLSAHTLPKSPVQQMSESPAHHESPAHSSPHIQSSTHSSPQVAPHIQSQIYPPKEHTSPEKTSPQRSTPPKNHPPIVESSVEPFQEPIPQEDTLLKGPPAEDFHPEPTMPSPKDSLAVAKMKARSLVEMRERRLNEAGSRGDDSGYDVDHYEQEGVSTISRQEKKKKKKKKRKKARNEQPKAQSEATPDDEGIEVEYVPETLDVRDPVYAQFAAIFETFKLSEKEETAKKDEAKDKSEDAATAEAANQVDKDDDEMDTDSEEEEPKKKEEQPGDKTEKLSKKKLKLKNRMSVAELKQTVHRPDVVEMHDVTAPDPKLLVYLKACRNTVPVPRHWCFKRKFLQGKRGIIKPPFQLPEFIQKTGIMEMREALQEKEDAKNMKAKMREKIRPKMGKIDIDYQKLHDAFFKWQTKPKMSIHGDLYYEGKEFETKLKEKKPGDLSEDLRTALGMPTGQGSHLVPPPWLIAMQRYGPPPSYPNLKIRGLNAPIPEGASFGYHAGGWGKPPVDEHGRPLYGDVFGVQQSDLNIDDDEQIDSNLWGELESESEESEESEEESEEEAPDQSGLVTPAETGLVTPSGLTSIPAGMETPDMIELRKRKNIEDAMESGAEQPTLYTVLPEKRAGVGGMMMGTSHVYDLATAAPTGTRKTPGGLSEGVEVALDPSELELDPAAMQARYDEQLREQQNTQKEDFSDMVAEHAARQQKKRKKTTDSGKAAKKYKEFKF